MYKELKKKLETFDENILEENQKFHLTAWFLEQLGYDRDLFDFEHKLCRRDKVRHADIYIPIEQNRGLFVETKKYGKDLDKEDLLQLAEYITLHSSISWGILTNGRQIYLFNNAINIYGSDGSTKDYLSKIVLEVEYNRKSKKIAGEKYLKYFSKEAIFDKGVTNYYKAIAQFLAKHTIGVAALST